MTDEGILNVHKNLRGISTNLIHHHVRKTYLRYTTEKSITKTSVQPIILKRMWIFSHQILGLIFNL
jgi:hypothetical protein